MAVENMRTADTETKLGLCYEFRGENGDCRLRRVTQNLQKEAK